MANAISDTALRAKWRGEECYLTDGGTRGAGKLIAKLRGPSGWQFFFQYFDDEARKRYLPIGAYDSTGTRGVSLQQARDKAAELSKLYRNGALNLHAHFARQHEAKERARRAEQDAAQRAQDEAQRSTLRQLLDAYTGHLERNKKQSAGDVRRIFKAHVIKAAPDLASRRAAEISVDDFVGLIGRLVEAEKGRTAAKLRSYLRAAYSLAIKSKTDAAAPLTLRAFGVEANPLASIGALSQFSRARDRNLSADELRSFLERIEAMPQTVKRDALLLCLLLGGQRPAQLLRAQPVDVDTSAGTITLYDFKGARQQPRRHVLPLTKRPLAIVKRLLDAVPEESELVFSGDGKRPLRPETVSEIVTEISAAMIKAKETRQPFELRDIRRTCETMLAALGVSSDVRAQLQSHGLGGVQVRHYDRHEYSLEKRAALEKWQRHLDGLMAGKAAKVLPMTRRKKA